MTGHEVPEECPKCKASLIGPSISAEDQSLFGATHYSRVISIYDMKEDVTVMWRCPDCAFEWERK